jgi:xylulokinase
MSYLVGIDLGTSSVKTLIVGSDGSVLSTSTDNYPISTPKMNYAEQKPEKWWKATVNTIRDSIKKAEIKPSDIKCIGLSGQMHGAVFLDKDLNIIRPSIIWCDQRSKKQIDKINSLIDKNVLRSITLNSLDTGFQIASLMWLKENEEDNYIKINKVVLPKDYIRFKLTGEMFSEYSDNSGTLLFDTRKRKWSEYIIDSLGLDYSFFPQCRESFDIVGYITKESAIETRLTAGTPVVAGCADTPAQLLGNGIISPDQILIIISTGGIVLTPVDEPVYDTLFRTNTFCNINNWYVMGALLNAGLAVKWLKEKIIKDFSYEELDSFSNSVTVGSEGLLFLPYLIGERTPYMDFDAKGVFFGLNLRHDYKYLYKATLEGVSFAIRDCMEVFKEMNLKTGKIIVSGGGANSREWVQILADVLGQELYISRRTENSCLGAAMLAGIGCGKLKDIEEACSIFIKESGIMVSPISENTEIYAKSYKIFKELYKCYERIYKKL